jgi:hypothetical protein
MTGRMLPPRAKWLIVLCTLALPVGAHADSGASRAASTTATAPDSDRANPALDKPAERRSGLVLGLMGGFGLGGASGYPNNANVIDNPDYYSASGWMTASGGSFLLMGALADYLNFGIFFGGGSSNNTDWHTTGGGVGLRVEAFPLYSLVPALRDLGVETQFGIGSAKLNAKFRANTGADGAESLLGVGVFYEWSILKLFGGHIATGPSLEYNALVTRGIDWHWALLGGRFVFYGGPSLP